MHSCLSLGRSRRVNSLVGLLLVTSISSTRLSAANPVLHKSIFHVDNAAEGCLPSDIIDHLKSMEIPVISCFECKSWRKLGPEEMASKGFRLCVEKEVVKKILDKEIWPRGIIVRPLKFKSTDSKKATAGMEMLNTSKSCEELESPSGNNRCGTLCNSN